MKKFLSILVMLTVMMTSAVAFAGYEETIEDDVDLTTVKIIAVALPQYYKTEDTEPTIEEFTKSIYTAGRSSDFEVISYDDIVANIRLKTGVDITTLNINESTKIFKENVANYADSYVVATVANNSNRPWLFFSIYNAADSKLLYTYSIESSYIGKKAKDYEKAAEGFYKQFYQTSIKDMDEEKRKEKLAEQKKKEEAFKAAKKKGKKVTYKTGKSKADMVKKK